MRAGPLPRGELCSMSRISIFSEHGSGNFEHDFIFLLKRAWGELTEIEATATEIILTLVGSNDVLRLTGSGFVVDKDGNLIAGTLNGVKMIDGGRPFFSIRDVAIPAADFAGVLDTGSRQDIADLFGPMTIFSSLDEDGDDDSLYGSSLDDVMHANGGSDVLTGNGGADLLDGGKGFDGASYVYGGAVTASLFDPSRNTGDARGDHYRDIEGLLGSKFKDNLQGDQRKNAIIGLGGDDIVSGLGGRDLLAGDKGDDILEGGIGADQLAGGFGLFGKDGNDTFVYSTVADSTVDKLGRDEIGDFNARAEDRIELSKLDAVAGGGNDKFSFIGGEEFSALGQVRVSLKGNNTLIEMNTEGNKAADMAILLLGDHLARLDASDFIL